MAETESAGAAPSEQIPPTMSYEAARDELLEVVRQLEAGGLPLERSLQLWERGEELALICQEWLDGARERLAARRPTGETARTDANAVDETNATAEQD